MITPEEILSHFGIEGICSPLGSGHIHKTYKVSGAKNFVLQRVNKNIFTQPEIIAANNRKAFEFLKQEHPKFVFPQPLPNKDGKDLQYDDEGFPWRIFPMIENTFTVDEVSSEQDAFEAAKGFGSLTRNLNGVDVNSFKPTLERFHDLAWRYEQFEEALASAKAETILSCENEIAQAKSFYYLVEEYNQLIASGKLTLRVMHNDTKVNNILFDTQSRKAVCAIDLDTLMPGYFIYDLGDMVRTFVSPVSEEEKDLSKVQFRSGIYQSLLKGYLSEMELVLTAEERKSIPFSGKMMTYIMALRMLADFLRGNTYYHVSYATQNLVRAKNQLRLLELIVASV